MEFMHQVGWLILVFFGILACGFSVLGLIVKRYRVHEEVLETNLEYEQIRRELEKIEKEEKENRE